jgi:hypothetical protein
MSAYIKLSTIEYPRHEGDIRIEYPNIGVTFICPDTYAEVKETQQPYFNMLEETAVEIQPTLQNGIWTQTWLVRPYTQEEIDAKKALEEYVKSLSKPSSDITKSGSAPDVIG